MKDIIALAAAAAIPTAFAVAPAYAAETAEKEAVGVGLEGAFYVGRSFDKDASGKHLEGSLKLTLRARLSDSISIGAGVSNAPYGFTAESGAIDLEDAYVWLRYSGYGRLVAGRADNAAESLAITAPDVGYGTNGSGLDSWGPSLTDRAGDALSIGDRNAFSNTRLKLTEEQSVKLSYFTPSVYGLRAGISFAPKGGNGNRSDYLFGGLRYDRKVQQFGIGISGGLAFSSPRGNKKSEGAVRTRSYSAGVSLSYDRATLAGSLARVETAAGEGSGWDVGIRYDFTARLRASLSYQRGSFEYESGLYNGSGQALGFVYSPLGQRIGQLGGPYDGAPYPVERGLDGDGVYRDGVGESFVPFWRQSFVFQRHRRQAYMASVAYDVLPGLTTVGSLGFSGYDLGGVESKSVTVIAGARFSL